ncbi:HD-GYP domain-containing protein [Knoellia aerolata]|uniref:Metal-dependent phosphohydrolase n=1 Tax=Knoellia aerolata DSM 18566 TaxID=1385519 RepID=A0A0A0JVV1_9MICO|nr:HD domain-containing phosphohydrolase [Knoellia aerolata]KGN41328.1 metal-dependent phosphohydrolase [Knoellia aerolata DSM 18566]
MRLIPSRVERLVVGLAVAVLVVAAATEHAAFADAIRNHAVLLAAFAVSIAVGEMLRVRMPSGRVAAPVSSGSAIGLALLGTMHGHATFDVPAGVVTLVVAAALCLGLLVRGMIGRPVEWTIVAVRTIGVGVTALLFRSIPLGGDSAWTWVAEGVRHPAVLASAMMLVSAAGLYADLALSGLVRARRSGVPVSGAIREELQEAQALTFGVLAAGPLVAFLAPVVGLLALPLGLLPMMLTNVAVRRYAANRATYRQTIATLSQLTDVAGYTPTGHASRVAERSVAVARAMGLHADVVQDLEYAALLHDLGQVGLRSPIPDGATVLAAPDDQRRIALEGARIVRRTEVLDRVADLMERQTTPFRHVREWGEEVPLASRIIKVANAFDDFSHGRTDPASVDAALERIHLGLGYEYDPEVVEALIRTIGTPGRG